LNWLEFIPMVHDDAVMYQASYSPWLILVSVGIAIFSSYVALVISRPMTQQSELDRRTWTGAAALTLGLGIWAMHFIGMLALDLPCGVNYNPAITFFSMLPGVLCSGIALHMVRDQKGGLIRLLLASLTLGLGIGALHFVGMAAMRFDGMVRYEPKLLVLAVAIAILLSFAALLARSRLALSSRSQYAGVAAIMGCAVSGVHYTAMASAHFVPGSALNTTEELISPGLLAVAIVATTVMLTMLLLALSSAARSRSIARQLRESNQRWDFALEGAGYGVWDWDVPSGEHYYCKRWKAMLGYLEHEFPNTEAAWLENLHPDDRDTVLTTLKAYLEGAAPSYLAEYRMRCKDGNTKWIRSRGMVVSRDAQGQPLRMSGTHADLTNSKQAEQRIKTLAHFDQLTGLPNRILLEDHFQYALSMAERNGESLAVMFLDLDHFKNINDTLGHRIGDLLLVQISRRLKAAVREIDTVARLGGDEFVFLLPGTDVVGAAHVAHKLLGVVAQPCVIEAQELIATPSIGIAMYPDDGTDRETLSKNADAAMYRVKQDGHNNFCFFAPTMQAHLARNLQLASALRHAIARDQLQLHYQPQIALQDGCVVGAEALLRWTHPELGAVSPGEFIPVAEDTGLIIAIGEWVLRTAVAQMKAWCDQGLPPMLIAVNLSAVQFRHGNLLQMITGILDEVGLPASQLELELTEAAAMKDPAAAVAVMNRLHALGIRMAIDDFGTGYSSLSYLKRFKVYKLKIDQSFVRDISEDPEDRAIVTAIVNMASSLGMQTIAEGVETAEQLAFLRLQGCNEVQGYYFSKPLAAKQFEAFVRSSR
jgi:diguanylate cyclase (GGDEF)-like protein/PAS domain S-box-containing protein